MGMPRRVPRRLKSEFTLQGRIPVVNKFKKGSHRASDVVIETYSLDNINGLIRDAKNGHTKYYGSTDGWLYTAFNDHPIIGKNVVIFGSTTPWYESVCLAFGCEHCTVIEYNKPTMESIPNLSYLHPDEVNDAKFEVIISISSFEHDGLGRYGDPIDPNGDFRAMRMARNILSENGLLFLSVPLGMDKLVWNAHRVYGKIRLPLLLDGWKVVSRYGYDEEDSQRDYGTRAPYSPILVLRASE